MTGIAAVAVCAAFTSCSHDLDFDPVAQEQQSEVNYESAFTSRFGEIAPNHEWGFDQFREDVTRTENANANEWADPNKAYGGLVVPPPLTDEQIAVVKKYFQTHPNLGYEDPQWTNYFMQQVYKGHTDVPAGCATPEAYKAADGNTDIIASDHMDHLAAIDGSFVDHINNFNHGDCSNNDDVLDNGGNANDGPFHSDKIMYMKESTTKSFGYYNSNGSVCRTEYTGLVSYKTIMKAMGAEADCLNDGWERSFMGFDFEQMVDDEVYAVELDYSAGWSADLPHHFPVIGYKWYEFKGKKYHMLSSEQNRYCGIFYKKSDGQDLTDADINDDLIESLLDAGYLPVDGGANKKWVKVGGCADGYFSDWIVCLTEAKKNNETPKVLPAPNVRVFAEDLDVKENFDGKEYKGDFDFNDVVFDVIYDDGEGNTWIILQAAGGTYHIEVDGIDVHKKFGVPDNKMVNTHGYGSIDKKPVSVKLSTHYSDAALIPVIVTLPTGTRELTAAAGKAPHKLAVAPGTDWAGERISIETVYPDFYSWVRDPTLKWWQ